MRDHKDDAATIQLVSWRMSVRLRPDMYFGRQRTDLRLTGAVLWLAVADALSEQQAEPPLHVRVVIETERQFRIADNGPGLPVDSLGRLGRQVAWLTMPLGVVRLAWGRSPRVQLRAVT
jgi:DNA gyrase/topoisomerase IV subunit B